MINPTRKDIDRLVMLVTPVTIDGQRFDRGRIVDFDERTVFVGRDSEAIGKPFAREDLHWACGKDRT
jgi:hypothetical protein